MQALISDYVGVLDGPRAQSRLIVDLLKSARESGLRTAILSNDLGGPQAEPLRSLAGRMVDVVVLSGDVGIAKPERRVFEIVAERLGVPLSACIFIDDSVHNVRGAAAAGMVGVHHQDAETTVREVRILLGSGDDSSGDDSIGQADAQRTRGDGAS